MSRTGTCPKSAWSSVAAARRLSLMNLRTMAGPGLSPLIGSALVGATGWRSIFALVSLLGLAGLAVIWRLLPETAGGGGSVASVTASSMALTASTRLASMRTMPWASA